MNTMNNEKPGSYFKLFACCIPVKGAERSTICDLQRYRFELIPNDLYDLLHTYMPDYTIDEIKLLFGGENSEVIDEYMEFLLSNELGFLCSGDERDLFPDLDLKWESPSEITNAIIDFDKGSDHNLARISNELDALGCKALELRFYDKVTVDKLREIVAFFDHSRLRVIYVKIPYSDMLSDENLEDLCIRHQRIKHITIHSAPEARLAELSRTFSRLDYVTREISSELCCGNVNPGNFRSNTQLFTESLQFNSCLNKKISIDKKGNIKNCPSSSVTFGDHRQSMLTEVVFDPGFRKMWGITKDQVKVCKDCEFRYMCTDCRVFIEDRNDQYAKPEKCKYDPYTASWKI